MRRECRERFPRPPQVSDPDMHHGTWVTHVPWCMPELLTSGFLWSWWRGKRSRHSQRMRNPQFHVSGKRPINAYMYAWYSRSVVFYCRWVVISFIHILHSYFGGIRETITLPQCQWTNPEDYGEINHVNQPRPIMGPWKSDHIYGITPFVRKLGIISKPVITECHYLSWGFAIRVINPSLIPTNFYFGLGLIGRSYEAHS